MADKLLRCSSSFRACKVYDSEETRPVTKKLAQEPTLHSFYPEECESSVRLELDVILTTEETFKVVDRVRLFNTLELQNSAHVTTDESLRGLAKVSTTSTSIDPPDDSFVDTTSYDSYTSSNDEAEELPKAAGLTKHSNEVYDTEITYIKKLYALCSILPAEVKTRCRKDRALARRFDRTYKPLRRSFKRLYKFHTSIILPHLEEFISNNQDDNLWLIFQTNFQTIEDLYKQYYIAIDSSQEELEQLCQLHPSIDKAMLACQKHLDNLYPVMEFNCGNVRFLRYRLLMQAYMKHLKENSTEYTQTLFIHDELARIAQRCEEELTVSPLQLLRLKTRLNHKIEDFDSQQLVWHGLLKKQSPRKHKEISQLYIIVFVDRILVCEESGQKLDIKRQLSVRSLTVDVIDSRRSVSTTSYYVRRQQLGSLTYYSFRVNAVEKSYEFLVDREAEKERWVRKLKQAIERFQQQHTDIEIRRSTHFPSSQSVGLRAPVWVKDNDVTRCQSCHTHFERRLIPTRRHHCRSCGQCVCMSCSTKNILLDYCKSEGEQRVCDACYRSYMKIEQQAMDSSRITRQVERSILFGDFRCMSLKSVVWIDLQEDYQLHVYGGRLDQVEDFSINLVELKDLSVIDGTHKLLLNSKEKTYQFSVESDHQLTSQENDYVDQNITKITNKAEFYTNLWYETIELARRKIDPGWYKRKRNSADSGISTHQ